MSRLPPKFNLTDTPLPYTTLFRSPVADAQHGVRAEVAARQHHGAIRRADHLVLVADQDVQRLRPAGHPWLAHGQRMRMHAEAPAALRLARSEEHTSELQSLMRISYAVLCLKKKNKPT